jgi:glycine/D-amino acid oxidase-like deaminating enzyme
VDAIMTTESNERYRSTSLWWDTLPDELVGNARPALNETRTADVCIVGAGYTGLWTAYYLSQSHPELDIVIVEAEVAGFGASGRNGGWVSAYFPTSLETVAKSSNREAAIALQHMFFDTVQEVGRVAEAEGIDCHYDRGGTVSLARTPVQLDRAKADIEYHRSWGFGPEHYQFLSAAEARERVGATDVMGGTYSPHCAAIHPARLARGLAEVVERQGVTIYEHTRVTSFEPGVVRTEGGYIKAKKIVRATEAWTSQLPGHDRDVIPVYSLMLATEPLPHEFWDEVGIAKRETFGDQRHLIIYGQRTMDNRFAFGGRGAPYHYGSEIRPEFDRDQNVFNGLWDVLTEMFPALSGHIVTHNWGGPLGIPRDWYPSVGFDPATGIGWGGGYVGDGVASANLAGHTLADLLVGARTERTALPWANRTSPKWEPEPLRWIGVNAGLRTMSAADAEEARTGRPSRRAQLLAPLLGGH